MNKFTQNFFLILFPFLPFWAWFLSFFTGSPVGFWVTLISIPIAFYFLISPRFYIPRYLLLFMLFVLYHLYSSYIHNPVSSPTYWIMFLLHDKNVMALVLFFIVENTHFEERFIRKMNQNIFIVVLISLLVSLIQIWDSSFFVSPSVTENIESVGYLQENRIFSIYSWIDLNSIGITFPILISILLNYFRHKQIPFLSIVISGTVVSFLTKARYVMLSAVIVFSQLLFTSKFKLRKKVYILLIFAGSIILLLGVAKIIGYDIQQVIDNRILEKSSNMSSANTRILSYYVFLIKFPEHPMFGVGPVTGDDVVQLLGGSAPLIHVGYLSYLYFYGLAGCLFLFLAIFYLLRDAWRVGKKYEFWGGFYGLFAFCIANATMVYFNFSEMGIILVIIYLRYFNDKSSSELSESES